jgi:hypothetical protein
MGRKKNAAALAPTAFIRLGAAYNVGIGGSSQQLAAAAAAAYSPKKRRQKRQE